MSKDNFYVDSYGQLQRRTSPPQVPVNYSYGGSSSMAQGMRPTLPPLQSVIANSPPPASTTTYQGFPTQQRTSGYVDTGYGSYDPYGTQAQQLPQQTYGSYNPHIDASYMSQAAYTSQRASPGIATTEHRRLPPLSVPQAADRYQAGNYYTDASLISPDSDVRSPQGSFPQPYTQYTSLQSAAYPQMGSARNPTVGYPGLASATHYHHGTHGAVGVERTTSRHAVSQVPYARTPSMAAGLDYEHAESTIKKKRKRADARQLEVLNATFARTQFPSTEERAKLAEQLDMTPRSVQIWFQNRRQALRQGQATRGRSGDATSLVSTSSSQPVTASHPVAPHAPVPIPSPGIMHGNIGATRLSGSPGSSSRYTRSGTPTTSLSSRSPGAVPATYPSRSPQPQPTMGYTTSRSPAPHTRPGHPAAPVRGAPWAVPNRGY